MKDYRRTDLTPTDARKRPATPERHYRTGVEKALFMWSRGRCYAPTCKEPVVREVDGEPIVNVQIAHICAHSSSGPRYDPQMSDDQRGSFGNLVLLCKPHHTVIDRTENEDRYPESLLRQWKYDRERDLTAQLSGLNNLTEARLQEMMTAAVTETKTELMSAIDELAEISKDAANTLRHIMAETYDRPYLDLDAVASLATSAQLLNGLGEHASNLLEAVQALGDLPDRVTSLKQAALELRTATDTANQFR